VAEQAGNLSSLLVVTDDPVVREALEYGFPSQTEVSLAVDAREAWTRLSEAVPSAVVVELQTGSAGGYHLAHDMMDDPRLKDTPIVILLERPQDAWLAKQAGARAYLVKPISVASITRALATATGPS
jgi:CheY-like chemotaxis protein